MTAGKIMEFPLSPPAGSFVDGTKSLAKCISEQSPKVSKMQKGHGTLDCSGSKSAKIPRCPCCLFSHVCVGESVGFLAASNGAFWA